MRRNALPHRDLFILVFNAGGEFLRQKCTENEDIYPAYGDVAIGGAVDGNSTFFEGVFFSSLLVAIYGSVW